MEVIVGNVIALIISCKQLSADQHTIDMSNTVQATEQTWVSSRILNKFSELQHFITQEKTHQEMASNKSGLTESKN